MQAPSLLGPSHDEPPPIQSRSPDTDLPQHCDRQGVQHEDMHRSQPGIDHNRSGASNRGGHYKQNQKTGRNPDLQAAAFPGPEAQQRTINPQEYSYAQPTGHPMTAWQGGLRRGKLLRSRGIARTVLHAKHESVSNTGSAGPSKEGKPMCTEMVMTEQVLLSQVCHSPEAMETKALSIGVTILSLKQSSCSNKGFVLKTKPRIPCRQHQRQRQHKQHHCQRTSSLRHHH